MEFYGLQTLRKRRESHHLVLMYRLSRDESYVESYRPDIELRSNNKIKLKIRTTKLTKVLNSPYHRGVRLWDQLSKESQRATTKVKFKRLIA